MTDTTQFICIGSVLWDVIGRTDHTMQVGSDEPGRIERIPGGVAFNIAMTACRFGLQPILLTALGDDGPGRGLLPTTEKLGIDMTHVHWMDDHPTDTYMAVEGGNGLIAAIADAHSLEAAGDAILAPLKDGTLGSDKSPFEGLIALDGNLTAKLLAHIADSPLFERADLRLVPASPGKAKRLLPFIELGRGSLYLNLHEANILMNQTFSGAPQAALALTSAGARRAIVTDGARAGADAGPAGLVTAMPPQVTEKRVTGAGDTFMAAHMAAELHGQDPFAALELALDAAAAYVSGEGLA